MVKCSFIVSTYNRPEVLRCCLASLALQIERRFEVLVVSNSDQPDAVCQERLLVYGMLDPRFRYENPRLADCYYASEYGARLAEGQYLCFPSDDDYYCPQFLDEMLKAANAAPDHMNVPHDAELIYCDCVFNGPGNEPRRVGLNQAVTCEPRLGSIEKGGFLVDRTRFYGFPKKLAGQPGAQDGYFIDELIARGVSCVKAGGGVLYWHNYLPPPTGNIA